MQAVVGVGTGLIVGVTLYPQTIGLWSYRKIAAQHINDEEQPVDEDTKKLAEQVLITSNLTPEEEVGVEFFTVYGQDTKHRGSTKLRTGAFIGLPATFAYKDTSQVQTEKIQLNNKPIDWESRAGELLLQSIVLSENAKKFAIAREIQYARTYHVITESSLRAGFTLIGYSTGFCLSAVFQLKRIMKRWGRGVVYTVIGSTFGILYFLVDDTYYCWRDTRVDAKAANLGPEYAEGGVEFYNKLLQTNMALRVLMGSEGDKMYTVYGNSVATWRRPHATLTERRDLLSKYIEKLKEKEQ